MKTFMMVLEYDGSAYHGWQRLPQKASTVQGRIEFVLSKFFGFEVEIHGAGRTDAGVHALAQTAHLKVETGASAEEIGAYLDQYLPQDIRLLSIREVPEDFHARFHAAGKHYRYQIWNAPEKTVFERTYFYQVRKPLDIGRMKEAAACFIGEHDFRNLTAFASKNKSTERRIDSIEIRAEGCKVFLDFRGDGFLHKMVRILAGTLIEVGLGERSAGSVKALLEPGKRADAGFTAPPHALFLVEVFYPGGLDIF